MDRLKGIFHIAFGEIGAYWNGKKIKEYYPAEDVAELAKRVLPKISMDHQILIADLDQIVRENEQTKTDSKK